MDLLSPVHLRVLKNEADYEAALESMSQLMSDQPEAGTSEAEQLETLAVLVRDYETTRHAIDAADPIEAIQFRMEQQGLVARDLIPYLGTRGRVSEVLARRRPLTLQMIRNLHRGLAIPAASLLQSGVAPGEATVFDWKKAPFKEMKRRGWIERIPSTAREAEDRLRHWLRPLQPFWNMSAMYRIQRHVRSAREVDQEALVVWRARVVMKAIEAEPKVRFDSSVLTDDFLREVARISVFDSGPQLAQEFLGKHGIAMVVEPAMPRTYLDGAAILFRSDLPVIALTLRYDRLDSFWFVLMHELVHLAKHLGKETDSFYDDLDSEDTSDPREVEADRLAGETLVPSREWLTSPASKLRTSEAVIHLATRLKIHPAIVAGRIRFTTKQYRILTGLIGQGEVRKCFPEFEE